MLILITVLALGLAGYGWYTRHMTFDDVRRGAMALPQQEVDALDALLADAGVSAERVLVVETNPDEPCWAWSHWNQLDRWLRTYRRFGRYIGSTNCIGIDRGHVVSLSLVGASLVDTAPLARLPEMRTLQLRENRLKALKWIPEPCRWTQLNLESNHLTDIDALTTCAHLETLNVSFNRLDKLPSLHPLGRLTRLDAGNNELVDIAGIAGHPSLEQLFLQGNHLTTLGAVVGLPRLEYVGASSNQLATLAGLRDLPSLRSLQVDANLLDSVDTEQLAALPSLRAVSLAHNNIRRIPDGYQEAGGAAQLRPAGEGAPELNLRFNPVADVLRRRADEAHDGTQIHTVAQLPRGRGRWQGTSSRERTRNKVLGSALDVQGRIAWLDGVQSKRFDVDWQLSVTATAEVERGRLRIYLAGPDGTYRYAEAIPGKPLRLSGRLISGTHYFIYFESVDGRAEGITWTISG